MSCWLCVMFVRFLFVGFGCVLSRALVPSPPPQTLPLSCGTLSSRGGIRPPVFSLRYVRVHVQRFFVHLSMLLLLGHRDVHSPIHPSVISHIRSTDLHRRQHATDPLGRVIHCHSHRTISCDLLQSLRALLTRWDDPPP